MRCLVQNYAKVEKQINCKGFPNVVGNQQQNPSSEALTGEV
jgi:hypothetical protein